MNPWQKMFLAIGTDALVLIILFPPQISVVGSVQYLPVWYHYSIDWLRLFFWIVVIVFVTGLGITANKSDHYR